VDQKANNQQTTDYIKDIVPQTVNETNPY